MFFAETGNINSLCILVVPFGHLYQVAFVFFFSIIRYVIFTFLSETCGVVNVCV